MSFDFAAAQFTSKTSSAGVVNVMLGFVPDVCVLIQDHGGTNPNIRIWANNAEHSQWAAALSLLLTGSTGVVTRVTSGFTVFAGGTTVTSAETTNSDPKHVDRDGLALETLPTEGKLTQPGVAIAAALQTAGGGNLLLAFRGDK